MSNHFSRAIIKNPGQHIEIDPGLMWTMHRANSDRDQTPNPQTTQNTQSNEK